MQRNLQISALVSNVVLKRGVGRLSVQRWITLAFCVRVNANRRITRVIFSAACQVADVTELFTTVSCHFIFVRLDT